VAVLEKLAAADCMFEVWFFVRGGSPNAWHRTR
jgi:hypothetical protein